MAVVVARTHLEAVIETTRLIEEEGLTQAAALRETAPSVGISTRSLHRWAATHDMPLPAPGTNAGIDAMALANRAYAKTQRIEVGERMLDLVEETLNRLEVEMKKDIEFIPDANDMKNLATTFAILTDKRRLEDGDPTSRHEVQSESVRLELSAKLDALALRKGMVIDVVPHDDSGQADDERALTDGSDQEGP